VLSYIICPSVANVRFSSNLYSILGTDECFLSWAISLSIYLGISCVNAEIISRFSGRYLIRICNPSPNVENVRSAVSEDP